ncbi:MAG: hypothetical protein VKN17_06605 [Cyanobacteriota bacterium]|jgi:hypothetical protein|nr:hypothetical protein [Cyanobacteriota bacterium]
MKVTHHGDEHLLCLTSEEVGLLVDLCHAGAFSDLLPRSRAKRRRLEHFLGEVRSTLMRTAQSLRPERAPIRFK